MNLWQIDQKQLLLALSKSDAAQNLPSIAIIAKENEKLALRILLKDENPALIENYLSKGSKSILKMIALDEKTRS